AHPRRSAMTPWLSVVGIGEDGFLGLSPAARALIETAEVLVSSKRHLDRMPEAPNGQERVVWTAPLAETTERVLAMRGRRVTVFATGDPMHYGIGATVVGRVTPDEVTVVPHPSSFALAAARLLWPLDRVTMLSVHGRPMERLVLHIAPDARLLILAQDGRTPKQVAAMLKARGFGESRMIALAHLGGELESRTSALAREWSADVPDLHVLAVECVAGPDAVWQARVGLSDDAFAHDGKLTKREVRAAALAKLMPHPGALLIDVGAGCGSISIEWMRAEPNTRAIAVEPIAERRAMAARNAATLGVPGLDIRDGRAPEALGDLPAPDAIFVGGGIDEATILAAVEKLKPGGRLVAHAVTLESDAALIGAHKRLGGDLARISVEHAQPIGGFRGWRPSMAVTQWAWRKA
ncbi:MAG: precorrin-6y C5,15-methyltransferase (decarboxylating) subunit CbiE, partial [Propylenella sp.]